MISVRGQRSKRLEHHPYPLRMLYLDIRKKNIELQEATRMKNIRTYMFISFFMIMTCSSLAQAATFISGEKVVIPSYKTYLGNVFIKGQDVLVNGRIKGDLFILGKNVNVRGVVKGDISVLGKNISLIPQEVDDIRAIGKNVYVRGKIFNDIMVLGGDVNIGGNCFGCAYVLAEKLMLSPYLLMRGDLWYIADTVLRPASAVIRQVCNAEKYLILNVPSDTLTGMRRTAAFLSFVLFLSNIAFILIAAGIIVRLMPNQMKMVHASVKNEPLQSIGIGALTFIAAPLLLALLTATVLGIPFAVILGVAYTVLLLVSKIFVALFIGEALLVYVLSLKKPSSKKKRPALKTPYLAFLLGLVIYQCVGILPFFGGLFRFFALLLGLGAIVRTRPQTFRLARKKGIL